MDRRTSKQLNCIFIGNVGNHASIGRVAAFAAANFKIQLVNVCTTQNFGDIYPIDGVKLIDDWFSNNQDSFYNNKKIKFVQIILEVLRILHVIPENKYLVDRVKYICNTYKPKFIVLHFGTIAIHYARIIKRTVPNIPIINIINLIPATIVVSRKVYLQYSLWLEYLAYKNLLPGIDGLVYSSKLMADTVAKKFQNITERSIVLPDYLPLSFNASNTIRYNQDEDSSVSLIFLGAPERWGNQIDDIDKEFMDIAERKIHVYSAEMSEKVVATGYGHIYPRFKNEDVFNGKLALYASGFSAALITYSAEMIQINERFRSTYPTRFFTAITAGIPIAVCNGLNDCGIFIEKYGIGFVYRDVEELIIKIKDKTKMISYRYNALVLRDAINAEAQSEKISKFVNTIIN